MTDLSILSGAILDMADELAESNDRAKLSSGSATMNWWRNWPPIARR